MPTIYADRLLAAMKQEVYQRIQAHNERFPKPDFKLSYPGRFKNAELTTLFNLLRAWAAQQAKAVNEGQPLTNVVRINNVDVQSGERSRCNVGRYLGKYAWAGLIVGQEATEIDPKRYQSQFEGKGKGYGWMPIKRFRGTQADYQLLIDPKLMPLEAFPLGIPVLLYDRFPEKGKTQSQAPEALPQPAFTGSKVEKSHLLLGKKESLKNKDIIAPIGLSGPAAPEATARIEERQAPQAKQAQALSPTGSEEKKKSFAAPAATPSPVSASEVENWMATTRRLYEQGEEITAWAVLLVSAYLKKLAPALGYEVLPGNIERGVANAEQLLAGYSNPQQAYDAFTHTIDRMQQRILYDPGSIHLPHPARWFDFEEKVNILGAYHRYYLPWQRAKEDFARVRRLRKQPEQVDREAVAQLGPYHALAGSIKYHLMRQHATDNRLRSADLNRWALSLRHLCERDKVPYQRACEVAKWWLTSDDPDARFFRAEAAPPEADETFQYPGIRSAQGFRRHYRKIETAFAKYHAKQHVA